MISRFVRVVAATTAAGLVVGGVLGGIGGRLAMRAIAATSDPALKDVLTDDDEPVGRITAGGTIGLIIFLALGGVFIAFVYLVLRRWMPSSRPVRAVVYALAFFAIQGADMFEPNSFDFGRLGPQWLAVAMFSAILLGVGAGTVLAVDWALEHWPELSRGAWYAAIPLVFLVPFAPILVPVVVGGGVAWFIQTNSIARRIWESGATSIVGGAALAVVITVFLVPTLADVADILA